MLLMSDVAQDVHLLTGKHAAAVRVHPEAQMGCVTCTHADHDVETMRLERPRSLVVTLEV